MTVISIRRWAMALTAAAAAVLAGCGGSDGGAAAAAPKVEPITSVESRVQPATAVQDVASVKSRGTNQAPKAAVVALGELSMSKVDTSSSVGRRLVGQVREIAATKSTGATQAQWQWKDTPAGGKVAAISFRADGAYGVRLGVLVRQLPGSAILRVYTQAAPGTVYQISGQEILQRIERNQAAGDTSDAARTWWTPDTGDAEATLEVELPLGVAVNTLDLSVPQLSHIFTNLSVPTEQEYQQQVETAKLNESDPCNLDATCYSQNTIERNAVARMIFVSGGLTYVCTGTLLNDGNASGKPYFLSANHCISSQTEASSLQTDWFFRSPTCNSGTLQSSSTRKSGGAQLLYASSSTDTSFMLLNDTPPAGAVFAGWDASTVISGTPVTGLHHPSGDLLKISFGTVNKQTACVPTTGREFRCDGDTGNFYGVTWAQGTTQGGSSGSAIFLNGKVVGTLYGGSAVCTNRALSDYYGRFDVAYRTSLEKWLAPTSVLTRNPVYRFYNTKTAVHFYTASTAERDSLIRTSPELSYENVAFYIYPTLSSGKDAVFRFYNATSKANFYSGNVAERDLVIANFPQFQYETISWYAQSAAGNGASPIYRFYNVQTGAHFYTISTAERDFVINTFKEFHYEGPVHYAWTTAQ